MIYYVSFGAVQWPIAYCIYLLIALNVGIIAFFLKYVQCTPTNFELLWSQNEKVKTKLPKGYNLNLNKKYDMSVKMSCDLIVFSFWAHSINLKFDNHEYYYWKETNIPPTILLGLKWGINQKGSGHTMTILCISITILTFVLSWINILTRNLTIDAV